MVGLSGLEQRLPGNVSGGQRKRAALARACVLDPEVVFCDEPTAALDPVVASQLDGTLRTFRDVFGVTIVAVTHDVASMRAIADRAIMLAHGEVCAQGSVGQLESSNSPEVRRFMQRTATP
jgi:phospholipid/cholesterol/gamma-HCH transport system ATP-binding protein